jgi:hypothetical protein
MSEFEGKAAVHQNILNGNYAAETDVPAVRSVLPITARMRHSRILCEGLKCRNFGHSRPVISTHTFGHKRSFSQQKRRPEGRPAKELKSVKTALRGKHPCPGSSLARRFQARDSGSSSVDLRSSVKTSC